MLGHSPQDVDVQVVHGRVDADDRLTRPELDSLQPIEGYDGNRWLYRTEVDLDRNGPFGYTVRILPRHEGLASSAELGLQVVPPLTQGMSEGDLR